MKPVRHFLCWFGQIYALLIIPRPGSRDLYGTYLRSVAKLVMANDKSRRILRFEEVPASTLIHTLDTRITVATANNLVSTAPAAS